MQSALSCSLFACVDSLWASAELRLSSAGAALVGSAVPVVVVVDVDAVVVVRLTPAFAAVSCETFSSFSPAADTLFAQLPDCDSGLPGFGVSAAAGIGVCGPPAAVGHFEQ